MTRHEGLQRLQKISSNGLRILQHLEVLPSTAANETELRLLGGSVKDRASGGVRGDPSGELSEGYDTLRTHRLLPNDRGAWKQTGISRLKLDGAISDRWRETFEAVVYKTSKYVS